MEEHLDLEAIEEKAKTVHWGAGVVARGGPLIDLVNDHVPAMANEIRRLQERVGEYERWEHGCKDHGCLIEKPVGMGTNGECRCPQWILRRELYRQQERVRQLELEAGEDANRQDLLKMIVGMIRPEIKHNEYSNLRQATIYITPAQFNAMAESVGEKGLE